jgi:hypothetical protein
MLIKADKNYSKKKKIGEVSRLGVEEETNEDQIKIISCQKNIYWLFMFLEVPL